jgi:RNA polymerase sporulation-specific sigma factor
LGNKKKEVDKIEWSGTKREQKHIIKYTIKSGRNVFIMIFSVCGLITFLGNCTFLLGYISNNSIFPEALTMEEEQKYIKKMENGDEEARKILIEHNLRLVAHVCKKYSAAKKIEFDDLVSIGSIGLIKGINTYNSKKSIKLSTYISKCIENEILMYFRSNKKTNNDVYLEEPIGKDKDDNAITLQDVIRNDERPIDEEIDNKIKKAKMFKAIKNVLNDREREIIKLRYGLDGRKPKTQIDIAKKMGISRSYVSRIESKAIEKLSKEIKEKDKIS